MFDAEIDEAEFTTEPARFADKIYVNAPERKSSVPVDSGDQVAAFLKFLDNIPRS